MKNAGSAGIAGIISAAAGIATAIVVYIATNALTLTVLTAAVASVITFFVAYLALKNWVFNHVGSINNLILTSLKNTKLKARTEAETQSELELLDLYVKRLIKEQSTEIVQLKELERMRKEFLGDVAHELRSPIFNIQGYIHTLIEGALEDETVSRKFLDKAAKHVDHLSSLVEDLVTISRIEAGELKLDKKDFDIKELINEVLDLQDLSAKQKNISLSFKLAENQTPLVVHADRQKIRQVLNNLVGNSIKYGRENGRTVIDIEAEHSFVTIKVADNGEGIAEEHLARVFERFYRVDKARARNVPSTGLGLAIVKHFIEAHKQKILVTSREGVGSIFSFTLQRVS